MRTYQPFSAVLLAGVSLVVAAIGGCAGFYGDFSFADQGAENAADEGQDAGSNSSKSGYGGTGSSLSGNAIDAQPPTQKGSLYAAYCGGVSSECIPGTSDCTPGGNPNMSSGAGGSLIACQIIAPGGKVTAACNAVGGLRAGDPCTSASHCAAGLGCVTTMGVGVCRPYCCDDVEACPTSSYCALHPMAEAPTVPIPVCSPVKNCKLLDNAGCAATESCTIVRKDGTTSCVTPGTGKRDEPCPCAAGYVCAPATATCMKLCHIGKDAVDCEDGGACQGGVMLYPDGVGVCVFPVGK
jgi:hypothetical protein